MDSNKSYEAAKWTKNGKTTKLSELQESGLSGHHNSPSSLLLPAPLLALPRHNHRSGGASGGGQFHIILRPSLGLLSDGWSQKCWGSPTFTFQVRQTPLQTETLPLRSGRKSPRRPANSYQNKVQKVSFFNFFATNEQLIDIFLSNRCKKNDDIDPGISSSLKIRDEGCREWRNVPSTPTLCTTSDHWDLLILKLDEISQKIEMILNKELFRHAS